MKYRLNKLPVKTTNNFKVNDLQIDFNVPTIIDFHDFSIKGDTSNLIINKSIVEKKLTTKIGLTFSKYLELDITIPKDILIEDTILIEYDFSNDDNLIDKININYEDNSSCNFIITYKSVGQDMHFHHLLECVKSDENSKGNITFINLMNDDSTNFIAIENDCLDNSNITHNIIDISGNIRIYNVFSNVYKNGKNYLNNIYIGNKDNIIDMNYYLKNIGRESSNQMRVQGTISDNVKKTFRGTIDFIKGCTNSIGDENENCVILSDTALSRSLPQMLCGEENVVGVHGVSSGQVDDSKLFYIMSRGFSKKEAEKLIVMANFTNILNNIPDQEIREEVQTIIEEKLSS